MREDVRLLPRHARPLKKTSPASGRPPTMCGLISRPGATAPGQQYPVRDRPHSHSDRGPLGGSGHAPSTTMNAAFWLVVARSHVVRDPPRIETCASAPRLWRDQGIRDAVRSPRWARRASRRVPRGGDSDLRAAGVTTLADNALKDAAPLDPQPDESFQVFGRRSALRGAPDAMEGWNVPTAGRRSGGSSAVKGSSSWPRV
jgi:hypothetical protein